MFVACPHCRCRNIQLTTRTQHTSTVVYRRNDDGEVRVGYSQWTPDEPVVSESLRCEGCGAALTTDVLVDAFLPPDCPNCGPYDPWMDIPPACGICGIHTLLCVVDGFDPACACRRNA
jgi:hypothetical protein